MYQFFRSALMVTSTGLKQNPMQNYNSRVLSQTRRERPKSALYLRCKTKAQNFLKKLEIFDFFSFEKCRIVPENVKGGPFGIY